MDVEKTSQFSEFASTTACAKFTRRRIFIAVRWIAAGLLGFFLFACAFQPVEQEDPLSHSEQMLLGTWDFPLVLSKSNRTITFYADRTCEYEGVKFKYPTRWRIVGSSLLIEHRYQTSIGPLPIPMPAAVTNFEFPSYMAHKESFTRSISFTDDQRTITLGPVNGYAGFDLTHTTDTEDTED